MVGQRRSRSRPGTTDSIFPARSSRPRARSAIPARQAAAALQAIGDQRVGVALFEEASATTHLPLQEAQHTASEHQLAHQGRIPFAGFGVRRRPRRQVPAQRDGLHGRERLDDSTNIRILDYLPLDTRGNMKFCLDVLRPRLLVLVKFDLWPNLIWETRHRGVGILLVDATLSTSSDRPRSQ